MTNYLSIGYSTISSLNYSWFKDHYVKTMIGVLSIPITLSLIVYSVYKKKEKDKEKYDDKVKNFTLLFALPPFNLSSNDYTIIKIVLGYDSMRLIRQIMSKYTGFRYKLSKNVKNKVPDFKYLPYTGKADSLEIDTESEIYDQDKKGIVNKYDERFMKIDQEFLNNLEKYDNAVGVYLNIFDIRKISNYPKIIGMKYIYLPRKIHIKHLNGIRDTFTEMHEGNSDKNDVRQMNSLIDFTIKYIKDPETNDTGSFVEQNYHGYRYLSLQEESDIPNKIVMNPQLGLDPSLSNTTYDDLS